MKKWSIKRSLTFLVNCLPVGGTVAVSVCKMGDVAGDCKEIAGGYKIRINKDDPLAVQQRSLWHQYAHARAGRPDTRQHSNEWGREYARIYRAVDNEQG